MTSEDIKDKTIFTNLHRIDVDECLIEPVLQSCIISYDESQTLELWTVIEERPDRTGYKIVFIPKTNTFGFGVRNEKTGLVFIGNYGSFIETFRAM